MWLYQVVCDGKSMSLLVSIEPDDTNSAIRHRRRVHTETVEVSLLRPLVR